MNYQYNQQPPQQMPQPPMYVNPEEVKKRKREEFGRFADKMADFCRSNSVIAGISKVSDILAFLVAGVCLLMNILLFSIGRLPIYEPLAIAAIVFGVLALSKKNALPLAAALSVVAVAKVLSLIFTIINLAEIGSAMSFIYSGVAVMYVFQLIFIVIEIAIIALPTILAWQYFAASLPPKAYAPMYGGQMPPQGGQMPQQGGQVPPQGGQVPQQGGQMPQQGGQVPPQGGQVPQQPYQQPPVQNYQQTTQGFQQAPPPVQPQAPAGKQCPGCGMMNTPDATFCSGCGRQI